MTKAISVTGVKGSCKEFITEFEKTELRERLDYKIEVEEPDFDTTLKIFPRKGGEEFISKDDFIAVYDLLVKTM